MINFTIHSIGCGISRMGCDLAKGKMHTTPEIEEQMYLYVREHLLLLLSSGSLSLGRGYIWTFNHQRVGPQWTRISAQ